MATQDTSSIKEKIINYIRLKGPSLPVHISKEINSDILFTSAFLSELLSEKRIKTSHMKVGSSSLNYLQGQEQKLENFSKYLGSKEREAFELLKDKSFLLDEEQQPAIRVALRAIRDFAIPFKKDEKIIWRYFTISENKFSPSPPVQKEVISPPKKEMIIPPAPNNQNIQKKEDMPKPKEESVIKKALNIFDRPKEQISSPPKKESISKPKKKSPSKSNNKKNEKFFNSVKEFLNGKGIEIVDIQNFNKNDLILKVKENQEEMLFVAFNKKKILEGDVVKAAKKAEEQNLKYILASLGEPSKKMSSFIDAIKRMSTIEKIG